jgi:predicted nucleic acid-binding protein
MTALRVFVDSDVLLAGSASTTGASHLILQLSELGLIDAVGSEQVRREVERNLKRKLPAALPDFRLLAGAAVRWVDDVKAVHASYGPDGSGIKFLRRHVHRKRPGYP